MKNINLANVESTFLLRKKKSFRNHITRIGRVLKIYIWSWNFKNGPKNARYQLLKKNLRGKKNIFTVYIICS